MLVIPVQLSRNLKAAAASNGAPGAVVQTQFGPKNPLHIMLDAVASVAAQSMTAAVPRSRWVSPPVQGQPPQPPAPAPLASPAPFLPPPVLRLKALQQATQSGWSGAAALALPLATYQGLVSTLGSSPRRITVPEALLGPLAASLPSVYGFSPAALNVAQISRQLQALWDADPFLASGDRSKRVVAAGLFARILADVWSSVTPVVPKTGPTPAPPAPPVISPARIL